MMSILEINTADRVPEPHRLKSGETIIGRNSYCDLLLDSKGISRKHARIIEREGNYFLEDLRSANGTYVNRERVQAPVQLKDGDTIHFYRVSAVFRQDSPHGMEQPHFSPEVESPTPSPVESHVHEQGSDSHVIDERLQEALTVVSQLGQSLELDAVLAQILDGLFDVFPQSQRGNIWLIDDTGEPVLRATKQTGSQTLCSDSIGPISVTVNEEVIALRKALLTVEEVDDDMQDSVFADNLKSSICVPLPGPDDCVIGAVYLDSADADRPFAKTDLNILTNISHVAGQATAFALQHELMLERAVDLAQEQSRRKTAEEKLKNAEAVQASLYPQSTPKLEGFEVAGAAFPTEEGCGDYFDFLKLADGRLLVVVGDVSGHGLDAALYMVQTRGYLRAMARQCQGAAELVQKVNELVAQDRMSGRFVTLFAGIIDPEDRTLTWCGAGHQGFCLSPNGQTTELAATDLVLGINTSIEYHEQTVSLSSGELILIPTDGFFEVFDDNRTMLGVGGFLQLAKSSAQQQLAEMID